MSRVLVLGVALAGLTACGSDHGDLSPDLRTRSFEAVRLGDLRLDSVELSEEASVFLEFGAERLTVNGCNTSTGDYAVDDGALTFEVMASSDVDCSRSAPNERPIIDLLESEPEVELERDTLTFTAADGTTLVAVDGASTPP